MPSRRARLLVVWIVTLLVTTSCPVVANDQPKPITTLPGELADLLRKWSSEGTAAGNVGDWYDNRDDGHSNFDAAPWPQLQRIAYSAQDKQAQRHFGAQKTVIDGKVVFGNSSTAGPVDLSGSNARTYYAAPGGLTFLFTQYAKNNLYVYPEHHDHDPGRHGDPGYGDLIPANTPYLIVSQGSSYTDQPFVRMLPPTLAAFRPEVKAKLVQTGLLMPTVQMIFRTCNKHLTKPEEYLTGKAHPSAFEGAWVDELRMAKMAHEIEPGTIPPMVALKVVSEDAPPKAGVDFFDVDVTEGLGDSPAAIARVWRGVRRERRMVVSAQASFDVNRRPLKYHWVLLRGDPKQVSITTKNDAGSVAEIRLARPERRPVSEGSALESNRADVGIFVHNGVYFSAPAFVTFFSLDNEARTYDANGRIREIGYGAGDARVAPADVAALVRAVRANEKRVQLLTASAPPPLVEAIRGDWGNRIDQLAPAGRPAPQGPNKKAFDDLLKEQPPGVASPMSQAIDACLAAATRAFLEGTTDPDALLSATPAHWRTALQPTVERLVRLGILRRASDGTLTVNADAGEAPTAFALSQLGRLRADALVAVVGPDLIAPRFDENLVDLRIAAPKQWRDVYRYGPDGSPAGWTRYLPDAEAIDFDPDGTAVLERDLRGRRVRTRAVTYQRDAGNRLALKHVFSSQVTRYAYANDADRVGRIEP